ncbi:uncharacterized protein Asciz [Fopius arisanus]|uniref:ATMIN protein n=1 Tax=Fopius arisanus TaxID=64838 RepID=A0A0C9RLA4_9HYME|nr:PREDICTED: uncharacterized protein LOC105271087 [Fopius arisanus]
MKGPELFEMDDTNSNSLRLVKMVCPSREELSVIVNNVKCNECGLVFKNEPRLKLHDLKVHQKKNLNKTVKECIRYHCPEPSCVYSSDSPRFFSTMKYLKQHYLKVHATKKYPCTQCDKSFSTEAATAAHMRVCGTEFTCMCFKKFCTYEALLTHAKRNGHSVDEKYRNSGKRQAPKAPLSFGFLQPIKKPISILPYKPQFTLESNSPNTSNAETQTDDILRRVRRTLTPSKSRKRRESRQTQTTTNTLSREKKPKKTVETQTTPSVRESARKSSRKSRRDLQETNDFTNVNLFPNLNLQHDEAPITSKYYRGGIDVGIQDFWEERNTLGTQTSPGKNLLDVFNDSVTQTNFYDHENQTMENVFKTEDRISSPGGSYSRIFYPSTSGLSRSDPMLTEETFGDRFSSIETQTEKPYPQSIFDDTGNLLSSSNTETQTTEHFDNIAQLLYNNMCTQTCNDILSSELGLSDIQTQTAWPELEVTGDDKGEDQGDGEKDISMTGCRWLNIQTSHTETQTDLLSIFDELQ